LDFFEKETLSAILHTLILSKKFSKPCKTHYMQNIYDLQNSYINTSN